MKIPRERLKKYEGMRRDFSEEEYVNLQPIQRGGVLTEEARRAMLEFGDGYSVCDWCPPKTARLDMIEDPPICQFYGDLAEFLGIGSCEGCDPLQGGEVHRVQDARKGWRLRSP